MEKHTVFMYWKNQYCENEYIIQSNLQIQCNPYQATNGIFHRTSYISSQQFLKILNGQYENGQFWSQVSANIQDPAYYLHKYNVVFLVEMGYLILKCHH